MAGENSSLSFASECLTGALLKLIKTKRLDKISVTELCEKAGVSRVTYYRNFSSVESILVDYLKRATDTWWQDFSLRHPEDPENFFWDELIAIYRENAPVIKGIYESGMSSIVKEHLFSCCAVGTGGTVDDYRRAALAGTIYGIIDLWIRQRMRDFPAGFNVRDYAAFSGQH